MKNSSGVVKMKSISIYALTRNQKIECLQKLERHLSGRKYFLKMREWELDSMKELVKQLELQMSDVSALRFFYSFQIPKLGKEFDLLQIKEEQIVNIELKSGGVSEDAIKKQLLQNKYYLSVFGKSILSYTYISSQKRLVKLTNHDHIVDADWEQLCSALQKNSADYEGEIEDLFQAELYLISPLTEPVRFLEKEYFLTSQQRDIERQILKRVRAEKSGYFIFTGLPGTGKTLLLYDIAMKLSAKKQRVCMVHCGESEEKWKLLHERLQRIDFLSDKQLNHELQLKNYSGILVDEAHLLTLEKLEILLELSEHQPVIFSSDSEDMISPDEMDRSVMERIENLPQIQSFHLTNRIRTNAELSSFIQNILHLPDKKGTRNYPHVDVVYANEKKETENLLKDYIRQGYEYQKNKGQIKENKEAEQLVMVLNDAYYYDEKGYLRTNVCKEEGKQEVRSLFHQLNQAKERLTLIIEKNEEIYEKMLNLL